MARLRLLGLHGYQGTAAIMREHLGPLLGDGAELVAVDAPPREGAAAGWWRAVDIAGASASPDDVTIVTRPKEYVGYQASRDFVLAACERERVDGIVGFSQGAAFAGLLVGERAFRCAIMIGGFVSNDATHASIYERRERYAVPSLHVLGRADAIVPADASRALAERFAAPTILEHAGGHVVPSSPEALDRVAAFLARVANE